MRSEKIWLNFFFLPKKSILLDCQGNNVGLFLALIIFVDFKTHHLFPAEKERQGHWTLRDSWTLIAYFNSL